MIIELRQVFDRNPGHGESKIGARVPVWQTDGFEQVSEPRMDYTKLTLTELANEIIQTERAIRRCKEILDDLRQPKTVGLQAVVEATRGLLPRLEQDLKALEKAYTAKRK